MNIRLPVYLGGMFMGYVTAHDCWGTGCNEWTFWPFTYCPWCSGEILR